MIGIKNKEGLLYPSEVRCICFCGKEIYRKSKSDLCFWCKRTFLDSVNKNLNTTVTIIE